MYAVLFDTVMIWSPSRTRTQNGPQLLCLRAVFLRFKSAEKLNGATLATGDHSHHAREADAKKGNTAGFWRGGHGEADRGGEAYHRTHTAERADPRGCRRRVDIVEAEEVVGAIGVGARIVAKAGDARHIRLADPPKARASALRDQCAGVGRGLLKQRLTKALRVKQPGGGRAREVVGVRDAPEGVCSQGRVGEGHTQPVVQVGGRDAVVAPFGVDNPQSVGLRIEVDGVVGKGERGCGGVVSARRGN